MSDIEIIEKADQIIRIVHVDINAHAGGWNIKTDDDIVHVVSGELMTAAIGAVNPREIVGAHYLWEDDRKNVAESTYGTLADSIRADAAVAERRAEEARVNASIARSEEAQGRGALAEGDPLKGLTDEERAKLPKISDATGEPMVAVKGIANGDGTFTATLGQGDAAADAHKETAGPGDDGKGAAP